MQLTTAPLRRCDRAGNTVVVKPSELAPATSAVLARWMPQYLDPEAVRRGGGCVSTRTTALARPAAGTTSSTTGNGRRVGPGRHAAPRPSTSPPVHPRARRQEPGGRRPVGQRRRRREAHRVGQVPQRRPRPCIAPDYVLCHDAVGRRSHRTASRRGAGLPTGPEPRLEPRLRAHRQRAAPPSARRVPGRPGHRIRGDADEPTRAYLVAHRNCRAVPKTTPPSMTDEISGRSCPSAPFADTDEALADSSGSRRTGQAAQLYVVRRQRRDRTQTSSTARRRLGSDQGGTLFQVSAPELPFRRVGESAWGHITVARCFEVFSTRRACSRTCPAPDPDPGLPSLH